MRFAKLFIALALLLTVVQQSSVAGSAAQLGSNTLIQVNLFQYREPVTSIIVDGPFKVSGFNHVAPKGRYDIAATDDHQIVIGALGTSPYSAGKKHHVSSVLLKGRRFDLEGVSPNGLIVQYAPGLTKTFWGTVNVRISANGKLQLQNTIDAKKYVYCVVGSETQANWPIEALKAQAVLTQTRLARFKNGDKMVDSTEQEAYLGSKYARPEVRQAVDSVWGQTLKEGGRPIVPFYCSTCAGGTSKATDVFGGKAQEMVSNLGVKCDYCKASPFFNLTTSQIPQSALQKMDWAREGSNNIPVIISKDNMNRPLSVSLPNGRSISGYQFWLAIGQKFGWDKIPGTRYEIEAADDGGIKLKSIGAGHGIGLCQWGAAGQANLGKSYREILKYYFPQAVVGK
jgi:stage II sporulation protein D